MSCFQLYSYSQCSAMASSDRYSLIGDKHRKIKISGAVVCLLSVGLGFGILFGYIIAFSIHYDPDSSCGTPCQDADPTVSSKLMSSMEAANIRGFSSDISSKPHLAGTPEDFETAEYIQQKWLDQGLDSATIYPYHVLLSYPDDTNPNKVQILNGDGSDNYTCVDMEENLRPEDQNPNIVKQFNAYSAIGTAQGDLVYVNYARIEDFDYLASLQPPLDLTGKIFIARYGEIFRGNKALNSQGRGAIGLILYSDPADYGSDDPTAKVYPDGWWLPGTGAQRGNLHASDYKGDPLTPGYPSNDYMSRIDMEDTYLPDIPVQPIGYDDAVAFLRELRGPDAPSGWQGGLDIKYKLGPGFADIGRKVKMDVHTTRERKWTYNIVGFIRGAIEPDRYVIVGNHRDAWVHGAVDATSGSATMLEVSSAFGQLVKSGEWRPRRSVLFCAWGAEEYGLVGSTEWVEDFAKNLGARSIAYLNVDIALAGNWYLQAKSSPLLYQAIFNAAKKVTDPNDAEKTVYDVMVERSADPHDPEKPYVSGLGSGSDFAPFMYRIGVPCVDLSYTYNSALGIASYPLYHTAYDTFYIVEQFMDPEFTYHLAVSRVLAEITRDLSDALIIPFSCQDYADQLKYAVDDLKTAYEQDMAKKGITFESLDSAVVNFTASAQEIHERIDEVDRESPQALRAVNDQ
ncbi:N-acetylated-alpha-linked acidic dipeptidase 2-like [Ptychodera flava]|uniref:N-acetylated-alpha-linked acidic dipeptidase 2-like n=1 Tax=Ptychodera flava TaxID=63121 RepID=UPI00396AA478